MKFTTDTIEMSAALSTAAHALSARSTMPILEGILVETDGNFVNITCTDAFITICARVQANVQEEGRVVMPGRLFQDVVRRLPAGDMSFSCSNTLIATIKCAGSRTTIAGKNADLFPQLPFVDEKKRVSINQGVFKNMIQQTSFAIGTDETHKILTGCLLEIADGEARMVALDGYRLAVRSEQIPEQENMRAVIPGRILQELSKILSDGDDQSVTLIFGETQLKIEMEGVVLYSSLLEGEFINYRQIIPTAAKTVVRVESREQLVQCVERAALMARENKANIIKFSIGADTMVITSNSEMGEVYEEIGIVTEGEPLEIAFNVKYMSDALRVIEDESFVMRFISPVNPCVIEPGEGRSYLYMVLPLRLNA